MNVIQMFIVIPPEALRVFTLLAEVVLAGLSYLVGNEEVAGSNPGD